MRDVHVRVLRGQWVKSADGRRIGGIEMHIHSTIEYVMGACPRSRLAGLRGLRKRQISQLLYSTSVKTRRERADRIAQSNTAATARIATATANNGSGTEADSGFDCNMCLCSAVRLCSVG